MSDKILQLIVIVVSGVIIADLVANSAGTKVLFQGFNTLFSIGIRPTDVSGIKTTPLANNSQPKSKAA